MTSVDASSRHMAWKSSWFGGVVIQDAAANGYVRPLKSYVREEGCHVGWESEEEEEREEERSSVSRYQGYKNHNPPIQHSTVETFPFMSQNKSFYAQKKYKLICF